MRRAFALLLCTALLGACAAATPSPSPTAEPTPSPTPSPTPTPEPSPSPSFSLTVSLDAETYLGHVVGYEVVALPETLETAMVLGMTPSFTADPTTAAAIEGYAARSMTADGTGVAVAIVLALDPSFAALPGIAEGMATGVAGASGAEPVPVTIAGHAAYEIGMADGSFVFYLDHQFMVMVVGTDLDALTAVADALITGNA
jgi:hypothetical protein